MNDNDELAMTSELGQMPAARPRSVARVGNPPSRLATVIVLCRRAPIVLVAIFVGTALIVCNPGYFWDDWAWRFQPPAQSIRIAKELGVFWGGYLTNEINSLGHPALAMRITALAAWVIASAATAHVLRRHRIVSGADAFALFLILAATHAAPIRFLTSVSMYNVYIASFWIGCMCLATATNKRRIQWLGLPFFFFSFYLNSLIVLYLAILVMLAARYVVNDVGRTTPLPSWRSLVSNVRTSPALLRTLAHASWAPLRRYALQNAVLLALPLAFVLLKRLTRVDSKLYGDYNDIRSHALFSSLVDAFTTIRPVLRDYFAVAARSVPWPVLISCCLVCFLLLRVAPRKTSQTSVRAALTQAALGWLLFAAAVYPYLIAGKPPILTSFYESRNVLPALAPLALVLIAFVNLAEPAFAKVPVLRSAGRDALLAYVIGASLGCGIVDGLDLWRDWIRQCEIMNFVRTHRDALGQVRTFVFDDTAHRIDDRKLWNYEYTGNLLAVYHTRERLGISVDEYATWPPKVPLISDPSLRKRFSLNDYDFGKPHAIVTVRNGVVPLTNLRAAAVVRAYLRGEAWQRMLGQYVDVSLAFERVQAEERVTELFRIVEALNAYKLDHGQYPSTAPVPENGIPFHTLWPSARIGPPIARGDIPGLFPRYMARSASMAPHESGEPTYLYISDGLDFKLVYADPPDLAYAKQAHPALIDPVRAAYGTWTSGAKYW